jgi:hypothetical protein
MLTRNERIMLNSCVQVGRAKIQSFKKFDQDCLKVYNQPANSCSQILGSDKKNPEKIPPCVFYPVDKETHKHLEIKPLV